jgi:dTDP-4-amino-4,6-dideoxygalactose transaminase
MKKILFNNIYNSVNYTKNIEYLFSDYELFRKKHFSKLCIAEFSKTYLNADLLLTHSATGALEIIATLMNLKAGDEIIMPSFTFVSTANAFVSKGATPVFIDINESDLNIDCDLIEQAITPKTKAIIAVHYAGYPCDINRIKDICKQYNLLFIEDAAMGFGNSFEGKALGIHGDFGVVSFDITKQVSAVQGGLLIINNKDYFKRAQNIYHLGTNRSEFEQGTAPYYEWVDDGSKYQMNELNAAILLEQLENATVIIDNRIMLVKLYFEKLMHLETNKLIKLMPKSKINTDKHMFYMVLSSETERDQLKYYLLANGIEAMFHYIPLHDSKMGKQFGRYIGRNNTIDIAKRILRLPLHSMLNEEDISQITNKINYYFANEH